MKNCVGYLEYKNDQNLNYVNQHLYFFPCTRHYSRN